MSFWNRPDILEPIRDAVDCDRLDRIRTERAAWPHSRHWGPITKSLAGLPSIAADAGKTEVSLDEDWVTCRAEFELSPENTAMIESIAERLMPWRKGPFRLFDLEIDSEWQSNRKWNRIEQALGDLQGQKILDVGCGNGYYLFRAAAQNPALGIGLDPSVPFLLQFELMQHFCQRPNLQIELLGAEHVDCFHEVFDVVLCMGILYHQKNPLQILKDLWKATRPGGTAIIESQIIPGNSPVALFPEDRYAKARNVFFVPTVKCLENWILRAGFRELEVLSVEKTTLDEQRKTRWTTFESLEDFLDPEDPEKTIEGYPAPHRAAIRAIR